MSTIAPASLDNTGVDDFQDALHQWQIQLGQRCLMIIDAAQLHDNEVLQSLYATIERPVWHWLYEDSALLAHADAGPVVVETTVHSDFCKLAAERWADTGIIAIVSDQPTTALVKGLRQWLYVDLETFGPTVLRPYDSRFLQLLKSCQPERLAGLAGADSLWLWSIDMPLQRSWTGYRAVHSGQNLPTRFGRDFERMLGWVSEWAHCAETVSQEAATDADHLSAFIAAQYLAGQEMPDDSGRLISQWSDYRLSGS